MVEMQILQEQKSVHPHYRDFFTTTASADFSNTLVLEISPGKVLILSARAAKLYLMCRYEIHPCISPFRPAVGCSNSLQANLSVTLGFRVP
jgi:hypothetical protein